MKAYEVMALIHIVMALYVIGLIVRKCGLRGCLTGWVLEFIWMVMIVIFNAYVLAFDGLYMTNAQLNELSSVIRAWSIVACLFYVRRSTQGGG